MGLFSWWRVPDPKKEEFQKELEHAKRKCKLIVSAYHKCKAANKDQPHACEQLDKAVVICYGSEMLKQSNPMRELTACINRHKGKNECDQEVARVKDALTKLGVYPVRDDSPE